MKYYLHRMKGGNSIPPPVSMFEAVLGFFGAFVALGLVGMLHQYALQTTGLPLIMAPFGASAVLLFGAFRSPLAQPRNVIGGHIVSATTGVTCHYFLSSDPLLAVSVAVPSAIFFMHYTKTLHPPGGATAFVTAATSEAVNSLGYWYVLMPCAVGSVILVVVALIVNNIPKSHQYPLYWFGKESKFFRFLHRMHLVQRRKN